MESDNWVVQNLQNALETWNEKLAEIWQILTQSPEEFKGGAIWDVIVNIHGALQAIGYALLVLFFVVGVVKTCGSFADVKKPEHVVRMFIRFALSKGSITYGMELMVPSLISCRGLLVRSWTRQALERRKRRFFRTDCGGSRGLWIFREYPAVGSDADRKSFYHDPEFYYDHECVRAVLPPVSLCGDCSDPIVHLCGRTKPERGQELYQKLCSRVSGGGDHCIGLYHLFRICGIAASGRRRRVSGHDGMELCGRADL